MTNRSVPHSNASHQAQSPALSSDVTSGRTGLLRGLATEFLLGFTLLTAAAPAAQAQLPQPAPPSSLKGAPPSRAAPLLGPPVAVYKSNLDKVEAVEWVKSSDLDIPVTIGPRDETFRFRDVPRDCIAEEHKAFKIVEFRNSKLGGPIGYLVVDVKNGKPKVVAEIEYETKALLAFLPNFPATPGTWAALVKKVGADKLNYGLLVSPSKEHQSESAQIGLARHTAWIEAKIGNKTLGDLFPATTPLNVAQRSLMAEFGARAALDPKFADGLADYFRGHRFAPKTAALYVGIIRFFGDSVSFGREQMSGQFRGDFVSTRVGVAGEVFAIEFRVKGFAEHKSEVSVRVSDEVGFLIERVDGSAGSSPALTFKTAVDGKPLNGQRLSECVVATLAAQPRAIVSLPWVDKTQLPIPHAWTSPERAVLRDPSLRLREIPKEHRSREHEGFRVIEYTRGAANTIPEGFILLEPAGAEWNLTELHSYHVAALESVRAGKFALLRDTQESLRSIDAVPARERNYLYFSSKATSHRSVSRSMEQIGQVVEADAWVREAGGSTALAVLPAKGTAHSPAQQRLRGRAFGLLMPPECEKAVVAELVRGGTTHAVATAFAKEIIEFQSIEKGANWKLRAAARPDTGGVRLERSEQGVLVTVDYNHPERATGEIGFKVDESGVLRIDFVSRAGKMAPEARDLIGSVAEPKLALRGVRASAPLTPDAVILLDNCERRLGIPRAQLALLLGESLDRDFMRGYDAATGISFAKYLLEAGDNWSGVEKIARDLGLVKQNGEKATWHAKVIDLPQLETVVSLLHLARDPVAPFVIERIKSNPKCKLNFSFQPERREILPALDRSAIVLAVRRACDADTDLARFVKDPQLVGESKREAKSYDATIERALRDTLAMQERAIQSSPEVRKDGSRQKIRVVVVCDKSLESHGKFQESQLPALLNTGQRGTIPHAKLFIVNNYTHDQLAGALQAEYAEARERDEYVVLMPIVHGSPERFDGAFMDFKDGNRMYAVDKLRGYLDRECRTTFLAATCYGSGAGRTGAGARLDPLLMANTYNASVHMVWPVLGDWTVSDGIRAGLQPTKLTVIVDGRPVERAVPRCNIDGKDDGVTLRKILFDLERTPLTEGRGFDAEGNEFSAVPLPRFELDEVPIFIASR